MWRAAQVRDDGSDLIVDEDVSRGIEPIARGYVRFSIPFMREYLLNNRVDLLARYGIECSPEVSS